ncbi:MAG TPA: tetratricopeptide repeat protein, partial [Vicinamibacterales bacterium]
AYVDQSLEPLFHAAASSARPTFVIVTSDHGEGLGDHGELTHGLFAYESTLHVPLIAADVSPQHPDGAGPGVVSHYPARHVDILPTMLDAADVTVPAGLPGHSLLGADLAPAADVSSYFEAMSAMINRGWAPLKGIVGGYEKYIDLPIPELYDLDRDPHEQKNLADGQQDRMRVLAARLEQFKAPLPGDRVSESPDVAAKLQSLGYTSGSAPRKAQYTDQDDPKQLVQLDQWIQEGIDAFQKGQVAKAFELYERVIDARPSMPLGYTNLAFLQWQSGDAQSAIKTLERAMHAGATAPNMATELGSYIAQAGKPSDAVALLEPIVSNTPNPDALNAIGIAYAREGRDGQALASFQSALKENPESDQAFDNIGALELGAGHLPEAQQALEHAVSINPRSAQAHNGLGVIAMKSGRSDEAFAEWKRAVALAPHDYDALFNLAMELSNAGRRDEARPYLERFAKDAPASQYAQDIARVKRLLGQ